LVAQIKMDIQMQEQLGDYSVVRVEGGCATTGECWSGPDLRFACVREDDHEMFSNCHQLAQLKVGVKYYPNVISNLLGFSRKRTTWQHSLSDFDQTVCFFSYVSPGKHD
jgi:hypothetical protein